MSKYYEGDHKKSHEVNGVKYTTSITVTRGLYTKEEIEAGTFEKNGTKYPVAEGAAVGGRKQIMIVFRKGHRGGAFRTYDLTGAEAAEFMQENSLLSSEVWNSREKSTDPKPTRKMTEADIVSPELETVNDESADESEDLIDEDLAEDEADELEASDETADEVNDEPVNTTDKFLRGPGGRIIGKNPNYVEQVETVDAD